MLGLLACLALTLAFSFFFSIAISRPVRAITEAAKAIARSEKRRPFEAGVAPDELHQLSEALDAMTAQLTERAAYVSEFAANVSHELKTPLTGIRGAAELLRESWREMQDDQRERFIDNIDSDAAHMQHLATRLLLLARIQNAPQASESVRLVPFFEQLVGRYGESIRLDTSEAPASIVINPDHLESAVRNLIDNAVRHGAGRPVDVTVGLDDGRLIVAVRDRGPGIPETNRDKVFDRFFTTERDRGGTGLGLAIVEAVAAARGGEVAFTTGEGGTTFTLML
jgi:two-component system sensor histidine kinase ChvG